MQIAQMYGFMPIYERTFNALAEMKLPMLGEFDDGAVFDAFCLLGSGEVGTTLIDNAKNLAWMCNEVKARSGNTVQMIPDERYTGIKGPNAQYILTDGTTEKELVFSIGIPPFEFQK